MPGPLRRIVRASGRRLSRVTTTGRHIAEVDGLRFVAIASVFVQHCYLELLTQHPAWGSAAQGPAVLLAERCRFGVDLFFVVSGFVLGLPFAGQHLLGERPVSLAAYYGRRVTRLEPPYVLAMGLWFAVAVLYWGRPAGPLVPHLLASLGYVHGLVYGTVSPINPVAWSLEVEVQFYGVAPLLACAFLIRPAAVRRAVLVGAMFVAQQGFAVLARRRPGVLWYGGSGGTLLNTLPLFLAGLLLADLYLTRWRRRPDGHGWADGVAVLGWAGVLVFFLPGGAWLPRSVWPYLLATTVAASLRGRWVRRALAWPPIVIVGGMCYSTYLLHVPLLAILGRQGSACVGGVGATLAVNVALWGAAVLVASAAFFVAVERPCMRRDWPARLSAWARGRPSPAVVVDGVVVPAAATAPLASNQPVP